MTSTTSSDLANAADDILRGLRSKLVWMSLGFNDVRGRYNRSRLGVFWASLSVLIFVGVLAPIYSAIMNHGFTPYLFHLLLGFIIWSFISSIVTECGREYINSVDYLESFQLSYFTLLLRVVWRNLVVLSFQIIVFLGFVLVLQPKITLYWLIAPLALLLIAMNALWMGLIVSVFATRFRDVAEILNNIMRLLFFATPVIWMPGSRESLGLVADLNPFYHLIELFRQPLIFGQIDENHWKVCLILLVAGWAMAFPIFAKYRTRISFWL